MEPHRISISIDSTPNEQRIALTGARVGAQSRFPESRHLSCFHRQPYCLGHMRALILFIALVSVGCHTQPVARAPFGQPGSGKIVIAIAGDVEQPGQYYVDGGAAVESLPALAGGLRVCSTCHMSPSVVYLTPRGHPEQKQRYSLSRTEQLRDIHLKDGDMLSYATRHF